MKRRAFLSFMTLGVVGSTQAKAGDRTDRSLGDLRENMAERLLAKHTSFRDHRGQALSGGKLYFYKDAGGRRKKNTFANRAATTKNPNPIVLDQKGQVPTEIWGIGDYSMLLVAAHGTPAQPLASYNLPFTAHSLPSMAALAALDGRGPGHRSTAVQVAGQTPGETGTFYWDPVSDQPPVPGLIIGTGPGQWRRLFSGAIDVRWCGATGAGSTDDSAAFTAAVAALPKAGGDIYVPEGTYLIHRPVTDKGKRVRFVLSAGAVIKPGRDINVFEFTGKQSELTGGKIDGSLVKRGQGCGIVVGLDGANAYGLQITNLRIVNMAGHGLVWENGAFLTTTYLSIANSGGDAMRFTARYEDNNHGDIQAHCSNNKGYALHIEDGPVLANRSRHHHFRYIKSFGNAAGFLINSHENQGILFAENEHGTQLEFGVNGYGNYIQGAGATPLTDHFMEARPGSNTVISRTSHNAVGFTGLQAKNFRLRDDLHKGSLSEQFVGDNTVDVTAHNTEKTVVRRHKHSGAAQLVEDFQVLKIGADGSGAPLSFMKEKSGTLDFGNIAAGQSADRMLDMTGAKVGMVAVASPWGSAPANGIVWSAYVSAADKVCVRCANVSDTTVPVKQPFRVIVYKVD